MINRRPQEARRPWAWLIFDVSQKRMRAKVSVVADGRERLMLALRANTREQEKRFKELHAELEVKYREELQTAGFVRVLALRRKIRKEADTLMRREFGIPSDAAMFLSTKQSANKAPEPTPTSVTLPAIVSIIE